MSTFPPRSSKGFWLVMGLIVISLATLAIFLRRSEPASFVEEKTHFTVLAKVFHTALDSKGLVIYGQTSAKNKIELKAEVAGRIEEVLVKDGELVKKGQPLLRLTPENRMYDLERARARAAQNQIEFEAAKMLVKKSFQAKLQMSKVFADLKEAEAQVKSLERDLARSTIYAPFEGILVKTIVNEGDVIEKGDVLGQVVNLNPLRIQGFVSEHDYPSVRLGDCYAVTLSDGSEHKACVQYKAPLSENKTHTFLVRLEFSNPEQKIPEGISATAQVALPSKPMMVLPASLLTLDDEGRVGVKVLDEEERVKFIPVHILSSEQNTVMVLGVEDGVRIIIRGQEFVREGDKVPFQILAEEPKASSNSPSKPAQMQAPS